MPTSSPLFKLLQVNRLFMEDQREINATLINTFLGVALWADGDGGKHRLSLTELANRIDLPNTSVSRHLRYLGPKRRNGVSGMGLVHTYVSPEDARQKLVVLTPKGMILKSRLEFVLNGAV